MSLAVVGNNTNRHTVSTSARCLEIVTDYGIVITRVGIFLLLDGTCVCVGAKCFAL